MGHGAKLGTAVKFLVTKVCLGYVFGPRAAVLCYLVVDGIFLFAFYKMCLNQTHYCNDCKLHYIEEHYFAPYHCADPRQLEDYLKNGGGEISTLFEGVQTEKDGTYFSVYYCESCEASMRVNVDNFVQESFMDTGYIIEELEAPMKSRELIRLFAQRVPRDLSTIQSEYDGYDDEDD